MILVYNSGFIGEPNDVQLETLQMLKDEELLHTVISTKDIEYVYRERYQKLMKHIETLVENKQIDISLRKELENEAMRQFAGTGPRKSE